MKDTSVLNENTTQSTCDGKKKIKNDIIFIAAMILAVLIAATALFIFRKEGDRVVVTVDGQIFGEYSLSYDSVVEINVGDGHNLLVIKNGSAYVESASCPDGICSSHRAIKYDGESIICLPNKVVIEVKAANEEGQPDIIIPA